MMSTRERVVFAIVLPVLALVAVWGFFILPSDQPAVIAPSPTAAPAPTVTSSPEPSPTVTETPTPTFTPTERFTPDELPTGEDFEQVLQNIMDQRYEAFNRRDTRILGQIYGTRCSCLTTDREAIEEFIAMGILFEGAEPEVFDVEVTERSDADAVVVIFRTRFAGSERIDASTGDIVQSFGSQEVRFEMGLLRGFDSFSDDRWVVVAAQPLTDDA